MNASLWNTMRLDGRTALITGAGKGLGRAIAMGLAQAGANVALLARTARDVESACEEIRATGARALPLAADATDSAQVDRAVSAVLDEFGALDILVHSAGGSQRKPVLELADDEWKRLIGANLDSTFYVCRAADGPCTRKAAAPSSTSPRPPGCAAGPTTLPTARPRRP